MVGAEVSVGAEIEALAQGGAGAGTSGLEGIRTTVLSGDPAKSGLYTIRLTVPAGRQGSRRRLA